MTRRGAQALALGAAAWLAFAPAAHGLEGEALDGWRGDVRWLVENVETRHPDPWRWISQEAFTVAADALVADLPVLDDEGARARIMLLVAQLGDDSSYVYPFQEAAAFHVAPLAAQAYADGLWIASARDDLVDLVGYRIVAVNGIAIDELERRYASAPGAATPGYRRAFFSRNVFVPELLSAFGVATDGRRLSLDLEIEAGLGRTVVVEATANPDWYPLSLRRPAWSGVEPPTGIDRGDSFWLVGGPADDLRDGVVYARVNAIAKSATGESVAAFAERLDAAARGSERLVLDLRFGGGGSGHSMGPLVDTVGGLPGAFAPGRIVLLIGPGTRGTVMELASVLTQVSAAVTVGECTGDAPNGVGDPETLTLPWSGLTVAVTEVFWDTTLPGDDRACIAPAVDAPMRYVDVRRGQDTALEAALALPAVRDPPRRVPRDILAELPGRYRVAPQVWLTVRHRGDGLEMEVTALATLIGRSFFQARSPLLPGDGNVLGTRIEGVAIEWRPDGTSELQWRGRRLPMEPAPLAPLVGAALGGVLLVAGLVIAWRRRRRRRPAPI